MKINVGNLNVLESGTIVGIENEPIDFFIDESIGFTVRLIFKNDTTITEYSVSAEKYGNAGIQIAFINHNNPLGTGNITPIKLGILNGIDLYFNYRIYCLDKGGKHFHYTWLLGKEHTNE